ncbi:MAG: hypothetical protein DRO11_05370 [Methanobacteriota archaeon]|nr:MAG: hypothetical protein DRO11_05370 [Euryarchaeota archaeon]
MKTFFFLVYSFLVHITFQQGWNRLLAKIFIIITFSKVFVGEHGKQPLYKIFYAKLSVEKPTFFTVSAC